MSLGLSAYGSVVYQLNHANMESSGLCDFVCRALGIVYRTGELSSDTSLLWLIRIFKAMNVSSFIGISLQYVCNKSRKVTIFKTRSSNYCKIM